jgi:hypothetical protein
MYYHDGRIQINPEQNSTCDMVKETVKHEVIHAYMHCYGTNPPDHDCEELVCTEIAAYSGSGQCEAGGSDGSSFDAAGLSRKECILRGAAMSSSRKCGGYHAAKAVAESLWDSCSMGSENY